MKKEVDGVVVEAKSILTALKIIKTVCEDNHCKNCPLSDDRGMCKVTELDPEDWQVGETDTWRALK